MLFRRIRGEKTNRWMKCPVCVPETSHLICWRKNRNRAQTISNTRCRWRVERHLIFFDLIQHKYLGDREDENIRKQTVKQQNGRISQKKNQEKGRNNKVPIAWVQKKRYKKVAKKRRRLWIRTSKQACICLFHNVEG